MSEEDRLAVELVDVHKHFDAGAVHALDGLSLAVGTGECVAVTGPSGCGKSTMLHLIAALDRPTTGTIRVGDANLAELHKLASYRRTHIGLVFQLHHLLPQLSAAQNVEIAMFGTERSRTDRRERARALLADVDLAGRERRPPTRLSGGERQRVAIARALANEPLLLLADEPTGNLDEDSVNHVIALLRGLRDKRADLTMIIVTHDPNVAASADRIVYLRAGRVSEPGGRSGEPGTTDQHARRP
ncbi:MAG: ABC transporter ATP-binding protein [Acidimicrobiales bacterium]